MKRRLNDNKDRIRMFVCVYQILRSGNVFYVEGGNLKDSLIKIDYIINRIIDGKGVNLGIRLEENAYVPLTLLIDRAVSPNKTVKDLEKIKVKKLEIYEENKIIEVINYDV